MVDELIEAKLKKQVPNKTTECETVRSPQLNKTNLVKSPSDTTLYTPALNRQYENDLMGRRNITDRSPNVDAEINRISNFVEAVRLEQEEVERREETIQPGTSKTTRAYEVHVPGL